MARAVIDPIEPSVVRAMLDYDVSTGLFRWFKPKRTMARGWFAGHAHHSGYSVIQIQRRVYPAHRLAFVIMTGRWPAAEVDHKDRNRSNNRWENLREATSAQNGDNRSGWAKKASGLPKGVYPAPRSPNRFVAKIGFGGGVKHIGTFGSVAEAADAYRRAVEAAAGEFAHHGQ